MRAKARHILVDTLEECTKIKLKIDNGTDFGVLATMHSKCPSSQKGGDLGEFKQGQMVKEFDDVVFQAEVGKVHGPVKTQFGYHLIDILERSE